jgi:hypothetical protein
VTRAVLDIADIARMLADSIEPLARELLPAGKRDGQEWRCGSVAGEPGRSLGVRLSGPRRGTWCDFGGPDQHRGDALDLVAQVHFGGDKRAALRWSRIWLGIDKLDISEIETRKAQVARRAKTAERDEEGRRLSAIRLFLEAEAKIAGTPADAYLQARGLDLAELGRQPGALRFHPATPCGPLSRPGHLVRVPAMVAAVVNAQGDHIATHRTFLEPAPGGGWRKHTGMDKPKMVLGRMQGGTIRLWRGASGKPMAEAPADDTCAIAEGIEDALTVAFNCPDWRVLAAISINNFANIELPPQLTDLVMVQDRDGENSQAAAARDAALHRWRAEARRARIALPPEGFKDFNDWWRAELRQHLSKGEHVA